MEFTTSETVGFHPELDPSILRSDLHTPLCSSFDARRGSTASKESTASFDYGFSSETSRSSPLQSSPDHPVTPISARGIILEDYLAISAPPDYIHTMHHNAPSDNCHEYIQGKYVAGRVGNFQNSRVSVNTAPTWTEISYEDNMCGPKMPLILNSSTQRAYIPQLNTKIDPYVHPYGEDLISPWQGLLSPVTPVRMSAPSSLPFAYSQISSEGHGNESHNWSLGFCNSNKYDAKPPTDDNGPFRGTRGAGNSLQGCEAIENNNFESCRFEAYNHQISQSPTRAHIPKTSALSPHAKSEHIGELVERRVRRSITRTSTGGKGIKRAERVFRVSKNKSKAAKKKSKPAKREPKRPVTSREFLRLHNDQSILVRLEGELDPEGRILGQTPEIHICEELASDGEVCQRPFKRREHLRRHVKDVHEVNEKYACGLVMMNWQGELQSCRKEFPRNDNLRAHFRTHIHQSSDGYYFPQDKTKRAAKRGGRNMRCWWDDFCAVVKQCKGDEAERIIQGCRRACEQADDAMRELRYGKARGAN
jgi:hypothetical protein